MSAITLKAHFDGKKICLDEPYEIPPDATLSVLVLPGGGESLEEEREAWFALSREGLARAYGNDEPDYSDCIGRFPPRE